MPWLWSIAWCGVLVLVCWLWSLLVGVTAKQWTSADAAAAVSVLAVVEAALLTVLLAPLLVSRIDLQLIDTGRSP